MLRLRLHSRSIEQKFISVRMIDREYEPVRDRQRFTYSLQKPPYDTAINQNASFCFWEKDSCALNTDFC